MKSILLLFVFSFSFLNFSIDKSSYYDALSGNSIEKLDGMIQQLEREIKKTPTEVNTDF